MILDVTCSTDDKYLQHCAAMLCSLFENNKLNSIRVHILYSALTDSSRKYLVSLAEKYDNEIIFYNISQQQFAYTKDILQHTRWSEAIFYRLLLPSLVNDNVDKILYLDCDVIVLDDISPLFMLNLEGYGLAAIKDVMPCSSHQRFEMNIPLNSSTFCSGIMMINLKYWREHNAQDDLLEYILKHKSTLILPDQEALNCVFRGRWFQLPYKWGKTPLSVCLLEKYQKMFDMYEYAYEPVILHYSANLKPWLDVWTPDRKYYWKYLKLSGYECVKVTKTSVSFKVKAYLSIGRYFINRYVRPLVPDIIETIVCDIINIIKFVYAIFNPRYMRTFIMKRWLDKY